MSIDPKRGGKVIVIEGWIAGPARQRTNEKTGEVTFSVDVAYFGGSDYCRLEHPGQRDALRKDAYVRLEAPAREFKDNMFAGAFTVVQIDGKPVDLTGRPAAAKPGAAA